MASDFDPSEEVELVVSFGTVQLLKEANKILRLFEEDEVVREIMGAIDLIHDASVEYLQSISGAAIIDESFEDEDVDDDEELAVEIDSEDDL